MANTRRSVTLSCERTLESYEVRVNDTDYDTFRGLLDALSAKKWRLSTVSMPNGSDKTGCATVTVPAGTENFQEAVQSELNAILIT